MANSSLEKSTKQYCTCRQATACLDKSSQMMSACLPLSRKNSPIAQPEQGAKYCRGAASDAVADTMMVYFMDPESVNRLTIWATVDLFCPIATQIQYSFFFSSSALLNRCWLMMVSMAKAVLLEILTKPTLFKSQKTSKM